VQAAEVSLGRTIISSGGFEIESLSAKKPSFLEPLNLSQLSHEPFRTDPALLSFDPASATLSSEPAKVNHKPNKSQTEPFRHSPLPPTQLDTSRTYELSGEEVKECSAPPVFIANVPSKRRRLKGRKSAFYNYYSCIFLSFCYAVIEWDI